MTYAQKRSGTDRRRQSRGGRRPSDSDGFAPLVMVVGQDATAVTIAEAILAKLRFAVTTSNSVEDAMRVLQSLRPEIVVATSADAGRLRMEAPEHLSVIEMTDQMRQNPLDLIESIRKRLRANLVGVVLNEVHREVSAGYYYYYGHYSKYYQQKADAS